MKKQPPKLIITFKTLNQRSYNQKDSGFILANFGPVNRNWKLLLLFRVLYNKSDLQNEG